MADVYKIGIAIALTNNVSQVLSVISRDLLGVNAKASQLQGAFNRVKLAAVGAAGVLGGATVLKGMGVLISHGEKLVHQQSLLIQAGVSQADVAYATAQAYAVMGNTLGTGVTENLELLADLRNRLGDVREAAEALPAMARVGVVLSAGSGMSAAKAGDDFARFLELRGALVNPETEKIDPERLKQQARLGEAIAVSTRFKVGPSELLAFQQQARAAGASLSEQGLINMVPYVQAGGGSRTGTQLSSLLQQTIGGVMTKAGAEFFSQAGLLDPRRVTVGKGGHISIDDRDGHAWKDEGLLRHDTATWIDKTLRAGLASMGAGTVDQQTVAVMRSHLRATVVGLLVEGIRSAPAFNKDADLVRNALGTDQYATMMGLPQTVSDGRRDRDAYEPAKQAAVGIADPTARMKAFKEAWDNLLTALGAPAVETAYRMLGLVTDKLTGLAEWSSRHQGLVQVLEAVTAGLAAAAVVFGSLALAVAAVTAAGMAAIPVGLFALAAGIKAIGAAIPSIPAWMTNMAAGAAAGAAVGSVVPLVGTAGGAAAGAAVGLGLSLPSDGPRVGAGGLGTGSSNLSAAEQERRANLPRPFFQKQSYVPPAEALRPQNIMAEGDLVLRDGTNLGRYSLKAVQKALSGPNGGSTGFDIRSHYGGAMPA